MIALILFSAFDQYIPYDWTYLGACERCRNRRPRTRNHTLSQLLGGNLLGDAATWIGTFPLATYGLEWIVPTFAGAILFTIAAAILKPKQLEFGLKTELLSSVFCFPSAPLSKKDGLYIVAMRYM